jgi:PKD repeat protein
VEAKVMITQCPECNFKLDSNTNFCPNCGKKLIDLKFIETSLNTETASVLESNKKVIQPNETPQDVGSSPIIESEKKDKQFEQTSQNLEAIPIYESKKKIGLKKPLFIILILIAIFSISLVGADYFNLTSVGIFENKPPILSLDTTISSEYQPATMTFFINAKDTDGIIESYFIDFGDGTTSSQMNPVHTYSVGTYEINVTVIDNEGEKTSKITTIIVKNKSPTVSISANRTSAKAPLSVTFNCSANDPDGTISKYYWSFNDGQTSNTQNPTHTFTTPGKTYTVSLTVTDNNGDTAGDTISITTLANELPTVSATANHYSGSSPLTVKFTGKASDPDGSITSYQWNFGDGSTSSEQNPSHTFTSIKTYTVTLTATDNTGGNAQATLSIKVYQSSYTFAPTDDAHTDSDNPTTNYGVEDVNYLDIKYMDYTYLDDHYEVTYLKFDLSSIPEGSTIKNAKINLYCWYMGSLASSVFVGIFSIPNTLWHENTITFANAPTSGGDLIDSTFIFFSDTWVEWDVTSYIQNHIGEKVTFQLLTSTDTGSVSFYSKENYYSSKLPYLDVEIY